MAIRGIPYFGEYTNEILGDIKNFDFETADILEYDSLMQLMIKEMQRNLVIVCSDTQDRVAWLHDIVFNYRDKECYVPYFDFEEMPAGELVKRDLTGHILVKDNTYYVRYNYVLKMLNIVLPDLRLKVYDIDNGVGYVFKTDKWYEHDTFDIKRLYDAYIECCFGDYLSDIAGHLGGYHYIERDPRGFNNREKKLRDELGVSSYSPEFNRYTRDYRDVRQYRYTEVLKKHGIVEVDTPYQIRRETFECFLYCVIRSGATPSDSDTIKEWVKLGKTTTFFCYGDKIKLIFKSYWFNEYKPIKHKTWMKFNEKLEET